MIPLWPEVRTLLHEFPPSVALPALLLQPRPGRAQDDGVLLLEKRLRRSRNCAIQFDPLELVDFLRMHFRPMNAMCEQVKCLSG